MVRVPLLAGLLLTSVSAAAFAAQWQASQTDKPPISQSGRKAKNGLPDGHVAAAKSGDISQAWYTLPTRRYKHGILGDAIEAGGLTVTLGNGSRVTHKLPSSEVFEDRTPRLKDLDGDGKNEIITLLSSRSKGASIAVFGLVGSQLKLVNRTPFIGRANRWRNIAGIADFNGDGSVEIAEVVTPHIGGTLKFWRWKNRRLRMVGSIRNFSNHAIGSREQGLSAIADFNADGRPDLALPSNNRRSLQIVGFTGKTGASGTLELLASIPLRAAISRPISIRRSRGMPSVVVGLEDKSNWIISQR